MPRRTRRKTTRPRTGNPKGRREGFPNRPDTEKRGTRWKGKASPGSPSGLNRIRDQRAYGPGHARSRASATMRSAGPISTRTPKQHSPQCNRGPLPRCSRVQGYMGGLGAQVAARTYIHSPTGDHAHNTHTERPREDRVDDPSCWLTCLPVGMASSVCGRRLLEHIAYKRTRRYYMRLRLERSHSYYDFGFSRSHPYVSCVGSRTLGYPTCGPRTSVSPLRYLRHDTLHSTPYNDRLWSASQLRGAVS